MLRLRVKKVSFLEFSQQFIVLFFATLFLMLTPEAFALQQLTNPDFTNGTTGWTLTTRIQGTNNYNSTINNQNNNLRIYANHNGNWWTGSRNYDGMACQTFRTPATAINVRFDWGQWSATGGNNNRNFWIGYSTSNQQNANVNGGEYLSQKNAAGNYDGGILNVTNLPGSPTISYFMCQKCPACSSCSTSASEIEVWQTGHQLIIRLPL